MRIRILRVCILPCTRVRSLYCVHRREREEMIFSSPSKIENLLPLGHRHRHEGFYRTSINYVVYAGRPNRRKVNPHPPYTRMGIVRYAELSLGQKPPFCTRLIC